MHDETEARVALHTRRSLVFAIVDRTNRDHPYDVPCVIAVPIVDGNPVSDHTHTFVPRGRAQVVRGNQGTHLRCTVNVGVSGLVVAQHL